jgi:perosamine synthetase
MAPNMNVPFLRPPLTQNDIVAAVQVLTGSDLTAGEQTEQFEAEFADYIGTKFAVAVNSGTSALDLIFKTLILKEYLSPGDKVIVPSFTFAACANVLVNNGLIPVFVDIDDRDLNMAVRDYNVDTIKAILAVHTFGRPANLTQLKHVADDHNIPLIEDCAEAIGAEYLCHKVGSFGHAAAFSFIATKNMTCGEGGMITTDNWETAMIARDLRAHGLMKGRHITSTNVYYPDVVRPGYNYRMTDFQAAIGRSQLRRLDANNSIRVINSTILNEKLEECRWKLKLFPTAHDRSKYALNQYSFLVPSVYGQESRDEVLRRICHAGVDARVYFHTPIHKFTYYRKDKTVGGLATTMATCGRIITLPLYPSLTPEEIDYMAAAVLEACQ